MKWLITIVLIFCTISLVSANALSTSNGEKYTFNSDTRSNLDGTNTATIYSGLRNVYDNENWYRIENANSLTNSIDYSIGYDFRYPVVINDFNLSSINICLQSIYKGQTIPVKVYTIEQEDWITYFLENNDTVIKCMEENNDTDICFPRPFEQTHYEDNIEMPLISLGPTSQNCTIINVNNIITKRIRWGNSSTEIIFNTTVGDGFILGGGFLATWDQAHDAGSGSSLSYTLRRANSGFSEFGGFGVNIGRVFLPFNTTDIPEGSSITKAELHFFVNITQGTASNYTLVQTTQPNISELVLSDYSKAGNINNPIAGANNTEVSTTGWHNYSLNDTGIAWIDVNGLTKLGIRQFENDALDVDPGSGSGALSIIQLLTVENITGIPFLNITFEPDEDGPIIELENPANNSINNTNSFIDFFYNVSDASNVNNCSLIIDGSVNVTVDSPTKDTSNIFTIFLHFGDYLWNVNCTDIGNMMNTSLIRNVSIKDENFPNVTLNTPINENHTVSFSSVDFNCSVEGNVNNLINLSLYSNYSEAWQLRDNVSITGVSNESVFIRNILEDNGGEIYIDNSFKWNCLAHDTFNSNFAFSNFTFSSWDLNSTYLNSTRSNGNITLEVFGCANGDTDNGDGTCTGIYNVDSNDGDLSKSELDILEDCDQSLWPFVKTASTADSIDNTGHSGRMSMGHTVDIGTICSTNLRRMFFPVNTTQLPNNVEILNVSFHFYVDTVTAGDSSNLTLLKTFQTADYEFTVNNFRDMGYVGEEGPGEGSQINPVAGADYVNVNSTGWHRFTLNSTGVGWINTFGSTKLGFRDQSFDGMNVEPAQDNSNAFTITINTSESDASPYLNITYLKVTEGEYISKQFTNGSLVNWSKISWMNNSIEGTNVSIRTRTTNTASCGGGWTPWSSDHTNPSGLINSSALCLQYKAIFQTNDTDNMPILAYVHINYTRIIGVADTCSCPGSGDWVVDCSDNCVISSDCNILGNNLYLVGSGTFDILSDIFADFIFKGDGCKLYLEDGNKLLIDS